MALRLAGLLPRAVPNWTSVALGRRLQNVDLGTEGSEGVRRENSFDRSYGSSGVVLCCTNRICLISIVDR